MSGPGNKHGDKPGGKKIDLGRRAFLRGRFMSSDRGVVDLPAAADAPAGFKATSFEPTRVLGPLPPALTPAMAIDNPCVDCAGPCVSSCEPDVIRRHPDDHPLHGLVYLTFEKGGCTFCGDCIEACPLERPTPPPGGSAPTRVGLALLDRSTCIAWQGTLCLACKLACTYQAIQMDDNHRPTIDTQACTGCGFCVSPCPTAAIEIDRL